jgi:hypothetical protein
MIAPVFHRDVWPCPCQGCVVPEAGSLRKAAITRETMPLRIGPSPNKCCCASCCARRSARSSASRSRSCASLVFAAHNSRSSVATRRSRYRMAVASSAGAIDVASCLVASPCNDSSDVAGWSVNPARRSSAVSTVPSGSRVNRPSEMARYSVLRAAPVIRDASVSVTRAIAQQVSTDTRNSRLQQEDVSPDASETPFDFLHTFSYRGCFPLVAGQARSFQEARI